MCTSYHVQYEKYILRIDTERSGRRKLTKKTCQNVSHKNHRRKKHKKRKWNKTAREWEQAKQIWFGSVFFVFQWCYFIINKFTCVFFVVSPRWKKKLIIRCQQRCRRRLKRFSTRDKRFFFLFCHSHWRYSLLYPSILCRMLLFFLFFFFHLQN